MTVEELTNILDSLLILPAETEVVEFKRAERNFDDRDLGQYFSALSNEANLKGRPCAWLVSVWRTIRTRLSAASTRTAVRRSTQ